MLHGKFDERDVPRLEAEILLPGFGFRTSIWFIVDTSAARTTLTAVDLSPIRDRIPTVPQDILGSGFSRPVLGVRDAALLILHDADNGWFTFQLAANLSPGESSLPSVLGRDVLSRCTMWWDQMGGRLEFDVIESDAFAPNP